MKKLILLALVALVAGAAFAETAPAFSGSFEFSTTMDFENESYKIGATNKAVVNLNGVVSEWATVTAELGVKEDELEKTFQENIKLNQFNLETDITGALGVDGPVGVSIAWGKVSHEADEYNGVAGYEDAEPTSETDGYWGFRATITIVEKVKLIVLVPPSTYTDWAIDAGATVIPAQDAVFSGEIQFLQVVDGLDLNVWYTDDPNAATPISEVGFTAGYVMGDLSVGALLKADLEADKTGAGIAAAYNLGVLTAGAVVGFPSFADMAGDDDVDDTAFAGINLTFHAVPDMVDLYGAVKVPFGNFDTQFGIDAGLLFMLAGVDYYIGYDYQGAGFNSPNGQGLYVSVKADF
jgi:hypothetical protein